MPGGYVHAFAVVRIDAYLEGVAEDSERFKVKEILPSQEEAIAEVERLTELNVEKDVTYKWQSVQYYPEGRRPEND